MQSSNPAVAVMNAAAGTVNFGGQALGATLQGTVNKSLLLVCVAMITGYFSLNYTLGAVLSGGAGTGLMYAGVIGALVLAVVTVFKPTAAPITAPLYAVAEGVGLGALSGFFEFQLPGIVSTAVMATFAVVLAMLAAWKFKLIVPTAKFRSVVFGATGGIMLLYLVNLAVSLFNGHGILPTSGPLAVLISVVICGVAALNLVMDFEQIENSVAQGLPKHFEYFNAFSLLVTICWLYIEILRLIATLRES